MSDTTNEQPERCQKCAFVYCAPGRTLCWGCQLEQDNAVLDREDRESVGRNRLVYAVTRIDGVRREYQ